MPIRAPLGRAGSSARPSDPHQPGTPAGQRCSVAPPTCSVARPAAAGAAVASQASRAAMRTARRRGTANHFTAREGKMTAMTVDPRAASGFATNADSYERGRPGYPAAAIAALAAEFGLGPASTVLDLAAGTGKLTRVLVSLAGQVVAVDPSAGMRAELARRVPGADVRDGTAEAIPAPDGAFAAVWVAEAFHWFRPAPALREIARVLGPGGRLVILSNRPAWDDGGPPWLDDFRALVMPYQDTVPGDRHAWSETLADSVSFVDVDWRTADNVQRQSPEDFVAQIASWSWIANLPEATRRDLLAQVAGLVAGEDEIVLHLRTELTIARAKSA